MGWKRNGMEGVVWLTSQMAKKSKIPPENPQSIFVLRNNDLGDLLVVTPLFEALRRRFPDANIVAGVGQWNVEVLKLNPYISEVLVVNAPWKNKFILDQSTWNILNYIVLSSESKKLAQRHFDIGIDILGSNFGSFLMMRMGIPYRLGVRGYGGGHSGVQQYVEYNDYDHVGRSALRFAELLGATELPKCRPQIFLSSQEQEEGQRRWSNNSQTKDQKAKRIVISSGGGFSEKCWSLENYIELVKKLSTMSNLSIVVVGGKQDRQDGEQLAAISPDIQNLAGDLSLRETFALVAAADLVICNSTMLMHAAAAFSIPTVVLLGDYFSSTKQHIAQWGYEETCYILGKEEGDRQYIYTPNEAMIIISKLLANSRSRSG